MKRVAALVVAVLVGTVVASCASVLDVTDYKDAADLLCGCSQLKSVPNCTATIDQRLSAGTDEQRAKWLESFDAQRCGQICDNALTCYDRAPVCVGTNGSCSSDVQCCGNSKAEAYCYQKKCQKCATCAAAVTIGSKLNIPICSGEAEGRLADLLGCFCSVCADPCSLACSGQGGTTPDCDTCIFAHRGDCSVQYNDCLAD